MIVTKTLSLFVVTAIAEIVGCYLPYLAQEGWLAVAAHTASCRSGKSLRRSASREIMALASRSAFSTLDRDAMRTWAVSERRLVTSV